MLDAVLGKGAHYQLLEVRVLMFELYEQLQNAFDDDIVPTILSRFDMGVDLEIGLNYDITFEAEVHFRLHEAEMAKDSVDSHQHFGSTVDVHFQESHKH